jgi:MalT-like TPR region
LLNEARELAEALGDAQAIGLVESMTGEDFLFQGHLAEAEVACERGLAIGRQTGPHCSLPIWLYNCGWTALRQGRLDKAREFLDESVAVGRELRDDFCLSMALALRGTVSLVAANLSQAADDLQEAQHVANDLQTG